MHLPELTLHEAASVEQAVALRTELGDGAMFMAGGTDLLVDLKTKRLAAEHVISLGEIAGLRGISTTEDGLGIGALTTIGQLLASNEISGPYEALRDAASQMAAVQIRNIATIGGNLASAVPCADLPPALLVLDAAVVIAGAQGQRRVRLCDLFVDVRRTVLGEEELLVRVEVPRPRAGSGAAYQRFALREGNAIAVASVGAWIAMEGDEVVEARISLGAVAPTPRLAARASAVLCGTNLDEQAIGRACHEAMDETEPISDIRASAAFRRELVGTLTKRAILRARDRAMEISQ